MPAPRDGIVKLCKALLPETTDPNAYVHWNQVGFDNLAKDYGQGQGTTCGFLPHWLLWRFGCTDTTLVNRSEPPEGFRYRIGENLSILQPQWKKRERPSWVKVDKSNALDLANGKGAKPGDFIIIRGDNWKDKEGNRTRDSAHIMVLLEVLSANGQEVRWRVAQSGASTNDYNQAAHITTLTGKIRQEPMREAGKEIEGPNLVFIANILGEEPNFPRRIIGYTDLDALPWGAPPAQALLKMVEQRWTKYALNNALKLNQWLGWYTLDMAGGFIAANATLLLLHRGHEVYRLERNVAGPYSCTARGLWTMEGNVMTLEWENGGGAMSWTMSNIYSPKRATLGNPISANAGKLTRVVEIPPAKIPSNVSPIWLVE
jgi:hypothetical protein